jgi:hypothetical protein
MTSFVATALWSLLTISTPAVHSIGVRPEQIKNLVTTGDKAVAWPVYTAGLRPCILVPVRLCYNNITPRPFWSWFESQMPANFKNKTSLKLAPQETIYTLRIGTNDVGANALLTGRDKASLVEVTTCMTNWVGGLYESGGLYVPTLHLAIRIGGRITFGALPQDLWEVGIEKEKSRKVTSGVLAKFAIRSSMLRGVMPVTTSSHAISESSTFQSSALT